MRRWFLVANLLAACAGDRTRVDVTEFGARGDNVGDDTASIQAAIDSVASGGTIVVPDGTYRINVMDPNGGLLLYSHQILEMSSRATLQVIPTNVDYVLLVIAGQTDVTVRGGNLAGDRSEHILVDGEDGHGHGIGVLSSASVVLDGVSARDFWGDGFYIGPIDATSLPSHDVRLSHCVADSNRRQGLSVTHAFDVVIEHSQFMNTHGTAPEAGIDLEPDPPQFVRDIQIIDSTFVNNTYGVLIVGATANVLVSSNVMTASSEAGIALLGAPTSVLVHRNVIQDNGNGIELDGAQHDRIEDNLVEHNPNHGIELTGASYNALSGNRIFSNGDHSILYDNLRLDDQSNYNVIERNRIRRGDFSRYGIDITTADCVGDSIVDNDLACAGILGSISDLGTATVIQGPANGSPEAPCIEAGHDPAVY